MTKFKLTLFAFLTFHAGIAQIIDSGEFTIGETLQIVSEALGENRTINLYLPASYHDDTLHTYPVIYLLDGSKDEDFIHIAGLVQFCSFSWINIIPESIVVGIANTDRKRDFTYPSMSEDDRQEFPTSGGSQNFINFLEKELQEIIAKNYRLNDQKTLIGQSLGGLLATEILFKHPGMFDNYIIISPSLWWDDERLLSRNIAPLTSPVKVYVGVGKEGEVMERVAVELHEKLQQHQNQFDVHFRYFENQNHGDALHLAVYDAFEKLFKKGLEEEN
ncbi:alpha/beta hydrolase [Fulvivirga sedimenti]|uniref:Alpha/beta hydrolase n=1 Tax=Fulvivirga sedimenti TaxID=2879465 RepID=A0A9X1HSX3_9BACT|nr:alpha/beta hydrolase [Fulvivirga sedimenti]MCA6076227.1 alpha/beta hydrolase [Fulvivirga sedimenti]MCA6077355.1 alpha/beta hydrolase [Fulvivirga sedimenti]